MKINIVKMKIKKRIIENDISDYCKLQKIENHNSSMNSSNFSVK